MNIVKIAIVVFCSLAALPAQAEEPLPHPVDYAAHAVGGALIAYGCDHMTDLPKPVCAFVLPTLVGVAWEATNKNFDHKDALSWTAGGGIYFVYTIKF